MKQMPGVQCETQAPFDTALVLGGGGMFGAYQAGVWSVLQSIVRPDVVIGASIGSINGWAIAGGSSGEELIHQWLNFREAAIARFCWPRSPLGGCVDREAFEGFMRQHYQRFTPQIPCAVAVTRLRGLEPAVVQTPDVCWEHLAASCAVPLVMPVYRVDGRLTVDGGLMAAVPVWAAARLGAKRVIAVNVLPRGGPVWLRAGRAMLHAASRFRPVQTPGMAVLVIEHRTALGGIRDSTRWTPENSRRIIELGRADAERLLPQVRSLWPSHETR